jgi:salicylate hydroxylase
MGRIYHAKGVERLVRNDLWKGRTTERFYDAMEWLYGWNVGNCLRPWPQQHGIASKGVMT